MEIRILFRKRMARCAAIILSLLAAPAIVGCGGAEKPAAPGVDSPRPNTTGQDAAAPAPRKEAALLEDAAPFPASAPQREPRAALSDRRPEPESENAPRLRAGFRSSGLPPIDESRLAAAGIRKLQGKHLTLYTDLPSKPAVDELPQVFDLAVPQWRAYFDVEPEQTAAWRMHGYLMDRREPFLATGLLPGDLPEFLHGFHRGRELWLYEQPSDYYRRHLLLHEGTHGFMKELVGGGGPPWYLEGMAELLGTHRWRDGALTLGYFPQSKDETPMWGRVKVVQDAFSSHRALTLANVFAYGPRAHLEVEPYGWSWAAAAFLDGHPRTQAAFRALRRQVRLVEPEFSSRLREALGEQWSRVIEEWQLFVANLEYGYDVGREAVEYRPGEPLTPQGCTVVVAADRGWQSSGVLVEEGQTYRVAAAGRYVVAQEPRLWECEPHGVTLRYHRGLPLGMLLGTVRREKFAEGQVSAFLNPGPIGAGRTIRAPTTGVLYFRINDSPAELADNSGTAHVRIEPAP